MRKSAMPQKCKKSSENHQKIEIFKKMTKYIEKNSQNAKKSNFCVRTSFPRTFCLQICSPKPVRGGSPEVRRRFAGGSPEVRRRFAGGPEPIFQKFRDFSKILIFRDFGEICDFGAFWRHCGFWQYPGVPCLWVPWGIQGYPKSYFSRPLGSLGPSQESPGTNIS